MDLQAPVYLINDVTQLNYNGPLNKYCVVTRLNGRVDIVNPDQNMQVTTSFFAPNLMLFKTIPVYNEHTFALITLSPQLPQQLLLFTSQNKFAVAAPTLDFGQPTDIAGIN